MLRDDDQFFIQVDRPHINKFKYFEGIILPLFVEPTGFAISNIFFDLVDLILIFKNCNICCYENILHYYYLLALALCTIHYSQIINIES